MGNHGVRGVVVLGHSQFCEVCQESFVAAKRHAADPPSIRFLWENG
jgi:hypothetical protein